LRPACEAFSRLFLKLPPLIRPPLRAISRRFSSSIAAKPRPDGVSLPLSVLIVDFLLSILPRGPLLGTSAAASALLATLPSSFGGLVTIVLEVAAAHLTAFATGFRGAFAILGEIA
jgi:hypothetical protein